MSEHDSVDLKPTPGDRLANFYKRSDVIQSTIFGVIVTGIFVILGGKFYTKWMPTVMSTDMKAIERLMVVFTWIAAPVCGVVLGVALYTFLNRHSGDTQPPDGPATRTNGPIVLLWSVVTSLLALTAVVYGITELNSSSIASAKNAEDAMVVNVTGSQWVWTFEYPKLGVTSHELMLPINHPVTFHVNSVDVNHSFWPVQLGVKVDANKVAETTAETTPNKLGEFDVKCAELCGLYHAYMETTGEVMTVDDFNNWVVAQGGHSA
ncbi:MAG: cytochrome c oxidase subunit II [Actinomycetales bacterium]|jgi:cytochrome c oxidase subunit 2|nr:MAG: cytochrome c oxidase subunit II [Actinomycetales bacterium]